MRNMGLEQLVLVGPQADPASPQARQLSTHGESILQQARIVADLGGALADCLLVAATSARIGKLIRGRSGPPEEILPELVPIMSRGPVALVFGPEASGLTNEEVSRCHHLIHIPAERSYPALNLAQAVAICLYELRRAWFKRTESIVESPASLDFAQQQRLFAELQAALEEIHFLYGEKADSLMHALRHLINRAQPSQTDVGILFGLARQIRWFVEHYRS
jgi:tRNA/rRNA methyltransferase